MLKSDYEFIERYKKIASPKQSQAQVQPQPQPQIQKEAQARAQPQIQKEAQAQAQAQAQPQIQKEVKQEDSWSKKVSGIPQPPKIVEDAGSQKNALELIKNALDQINFALHLLEGIKKPPSYLLLEKVAEISEKIEAIDAEESNDAAISSTNEVETDAAETESITIDQVEDVDEDEIIKTLNQETKPIIRQTIEEEFKIVLPKKSKNKKASTSSMTLFVIEKEKEKERKDEFPSLGSSFSPIKKEKSGFWREGTKSLEIAKAIAHIPSPSPTSSPSPFAASPYLKKSNKVRNIDEDSDEEVEEFKIRKREDNEFWQ